MGAPMLKEHNPYLGPKEVVIREGLQMVRKIANRYQKFCYATGTDIEDLISEGVIGLLLAYDRFDSHFKGASFNSYAYHYIKGHIVNFIRDKAGSVRFPQKANLLMAQISQENLENKTPERVAEHLGVCPKKIAGIVRLTCLRNINSLNQAVNAGSDNSKAELIDFIKYREDFSGILVEQFIRTLESSEKKMIGLMMQGFKQYEVARRLSVTRTKAADMLAEIQDKATLYFGLNWGSEGSFMEKKFNVTKDQYQKLRERGYTDSRIAEHFGMGDSALYKRKKEWGLVETKKPKKTIEESDSNMRMDQEIGRLNSQIVELENKLSRIESENGLLWKMVKLLKEESQ